MSSNQSSFLRDLVGFLVGAVVAAASAGLIFAVFYPPLPESNPSRHDRGAALAILVIVMFFCGGFIGRRGFSAQFLSDLRWPVVGSYVVAAFLCVLASFSLAETATMLAFATAGILSSAVVSLTLLWRLPVKGEQ
jgi:hypothetical protein